MIPLFKPYMPKEIGELDEILNSGQLSYGKYSRTFENNLAKYIGIERVLCTNSFNSAFLVLIKTLDLNYGDEVLASPLCCLASSQPFAVNGVSLKWVDVDPHTGTLHPESVKTAITTKTKAILHNHFCGYVGYVQEIRKIADEYGLLLIDDVSEAFGSEWHNKKAGNWGADAAIYSFQTVRLPNSIDGGGISFKDNSLYEKAVLLRDYGIDRKSFRDERGEISTLCDITLASYGCLPSEVNSYIGNQSLKMVPELINKQRRNADKILSILQSDLIPLKPLPETTPNYWIYGVMAKDKKKMISEYRRENICGISSVHLPNSYYSLFGKQDECLGVKEFYDHFVALPSGWWV